MKDWRSVIFLDLDGTLIVNPFESAVWPAVLDELARKSGRCAPDLMEQIAAEYFRRQDDADCPPVLAMDWDDIVRVIADGLGQALECRCDDLVRRYAASHSRVLDDGHDVLRRLAAPGRALVVATKGLARYQMPVLDVLGLTPLFTAVLTPDVHGGLKKHRRFFGDWPQRARLSVMVGDLYDDDVRYPAQHGFRTVWKRTDLAADLRASDPFTRAARYGYGVDQPVRADSIITTLQELPDVVSQMERDDRLT